MGRFRPLVKPEHIAHAMDGLPPRVLLRVYEQMPKDQFDNALPAFAPETVELLADRTRALPVNDPQDRELTISCGCALFNLRVGTVLKLQGQELEPYVGVDNLTDRRYYDNLRINDTGARYYEPGPGRTLYAGIRASF